MEVSIISYRTQQTRQSACRSDIFASNPAVKMTTFYSCAYWRGGLLAATIANSQVLRNPIFRFRKSRSEFWPPLPFRKSRPLLSCGTTSWVGSELFARSAPARCLEHVSTCSEMPAMSTTAQGASLGKSKIFDSKILVVSFGPLLPFLCPQLCPELAHEWYLEILWNLSRIVVFSFQASGKSARKTLGGPGVLSRWSPSPQYALPHYKTPKTIKNHQKSSKITKKQWNALEFTYFWWFFVRRVRINRSNNDDENFL